MIVVRVERDLLVDGARGNTDGQSIEMRPVPGQVGDSAPHVLQAVDDGCRTVGAEVGPLMVVAWHSQVRCRVGVERDQLVD